MSYCRGIYAYGFEKPSAIQQRAIVPLIDRKDTIAQAQSGMGKTATFVIGVLQNIDVSQKKVQALILAPTRELAQQIQKVGPCAHEGFVEMKGCSFFFMRCGCQVVVDIGSFLNLTCYSCIGGTSVQDDIRRLTGDTPHVLVGTPGRVFDMIATRRVLDTTYIKVFILDEADEMLSRVFKDQIYDVFKYMNTTCQVGS